MTSNQEFLDKILMPKKRNGTTIRLPEDTFGIKEEFLSIFPGYGGLLDWTFHGLQEANWSTEMFEKMNAKEIISGSAGVFLDKHYKRSSSSKIKNKTSYELLSYYITLGITGVGPNYNGYNKKRKEGFENLNGLLQIKLNMQEIKMNLFKRGSLRERISNIPKRDMKIFEESLYKKLHSYVPERDYNKRLEKGEKSSKLTCLSFLPKSPKKGEHSEIYANKICNLLSQVYKSSLEPSKVVSVETSKSPYHINSKLRV